MRILPILFSFMFMHLMIFSQSVGSRDSSFSSDGIDTIDLGGGAENSLFLLIQPDGKIVSGGSEWNGTQNVFIVLARHNTDGSRDMTFGTNGKVSIRFTTRWLIPADAVLQPDGKIVVAGSYDDTFSNNFLLARYNTNGTMDASFGSGGFMQLDLVHGSTLDEGYAVDVQPDGKIVIGGTAKPPFGSNGSFAMMRVDASGAIDPTFGTNGVVIDTPWVSGNQIIKDLAVLSSGKIMIAGSIDDSTFQSVFCVGRFNSNGTLDSTFGTNGTVKLHFGSSSSEATSLTMLPNGKFLAAGWANLQGTPNKEICLARFNASGTLDNTFGTGGTVEIPNSAATYEYANSVKMQPDGKYIVGGVGRASAAFIDYGLLLRLTSSGSIDNTFGVNGRTQSADVYSVTAVALQPNGRIVATGKNNMDYYVARYFSAFGVWREDKKTEESELTIFPNPSSQSAMARFNANKPEEIKLELVSIDGKVSKVLYKGFSVSGMNEIKLDIPEYISQGNYYISLSGKEGTHRVFKFQKIMD